MLRRTPRFSRTRMNESAKVRSVEYNTGSADYGRISYLWSMDDEFEMTDGLNKQIQKVMIGTSGPFNIEKLEDLLSDTFDTKMGIISCRVCSRNEFSLTFTGINVLFEITVYF